VSISLTYFDFDGSRGLECRLALHAAGVAFEDIRLSRAQWLEQRPSLPFGSLPVLRVGERSIAQSTAILVYIGRSHDLHPADDWTAAEHEALMLSVGDLRDRIPGSRGMPDDEKRAAREAFAAGWLARWADTVSARIAGPFLEGADLHVADIKLYVIARAFRSGTYDFIPATVFDDHPALLSLHAAVDAHPAVRGYFATR